MYMYMLLCMCVYIANGMVREVVVCAHVCAHVYMY